MAMSEPNPAKIPPAKADSAPALGKLGIELGVKVIWIGVVDTGVGTVRVTTTGVGTFLYTIVGGTTGAGAGLGVG